MASCNATDSRSTGRPRDATRSLLRVALVVGFAAVLAGCVQGIDERGHPPAPHEVNETGIVSPVQLINGQGTFEEVSARAPPAETWTLDGSLRIHTDDGEAINADEATVTNMTEAAQARQLRLDHADFSVIGERAVIPSVDDDNEIALVGRVRVSGYIETDDFNGTGQIRSNHVSLQPGDRFSFEFAGGSQLGVPDGPGAQATGLRVEEGAGTLDLDVGSESIQPPWEGWFTELSLEPSSEPGDETRLKGVLVQLFDDGAAVFGCELVLDNGGSDAAQLTVEGSGTAVNATLILRYENGTTETVPLDDTRPRPAGDERRQLLPGPTYELPAPDDAAGGAGPSVASWSVDAGNCTLNDRRG